MLIARALRSKRLQMVLLTCLPGLAGNHLTAQTRSAGTAVISPQQIAAVLRQKLPDAAQETGGGLYDGSGFRIGTLQRKLPGEVEIHHTDTDIIYVLSGSAVLVTGGEVAGLHPVSATEERGTAIRNGLRHRLSAGEVVVIPKLEPHWFQSVSGEVSYLVVKLQ